MSGARALRGLWAAPVALFALLAGSLPMVGAAFAVPAERQAAAADLYVAPDAAPGGNGTVEQPFATIDQARQPAHRLSADSDVVVHLAGGTYRQAKPLTFGSGDGGQNGHTITYQAMPGQQPVVSGAQQISGWQVHDQSSSLWSVHVGTGVNTRQLYVNGKQAPRAAIQVPRSGFTFTQTGLTFTDSSLDYLAGLSDQSHMEVESLNSFTDRYAPVQSISGRTITMQQPAWNNNSWGYDTINAPFAAWDHVPGEQLRVPQAGRTVVPRLVHRRPLLPGAGGAEPEQPRRRTAQAAEPVGHQRQLRLTRDRPRLHAASGSPGPPGSARADPTGTRTSRAAHTSPRPTRCPPTG